MVNQRRTAGVMELKVNGDLLRAVGDFTYSDGKPKREAMVGSTGVDGYKEMPQVPYIEGTIRDTARTDTDAIQKIEDVTVTLTMANGKTKILRNAWFAGEGTGHTDEGTFDVRFEGMSMETQTS